MMISLDPVDHPAPAPPPVSAQIGGPQRGQARPSQPLVRATHTSSGRGAKRAGATALLTRAGVSAGAELTPAQDDVQARRSARGAYPLPQRSERCPPGRAVRELPECRRCPASHTSEHEGDRAAHRGIHTLAKPSRQASLRSSARRRRCQGRSLLARLRPGAKRVADCPVVANRGRAVALGPEVSVKPRIAEKSPQIPNIGAPHLFCRNRVVSRDFAPAGRLEVTTENRGVPGSSPGLAILKPEIPHGCGIFCLAGQYRLELPAPRVVVVTSAV
jgi:hypothetical protein